MFFNTSSLFSIDPGFILMSRNIGTFSHEITVTTRCLSMGPSRGESPVWLWSYSCILGQPCHLPHSLFIRAEDTPFLFHPATVRLRAAGIQCGIRFTIEQCHFICHWGVKAAEHTADLNFFFVQLKWFTLPHAATRPPRLWNDTCWGQDVIWIIGGQECPFQDVCRRRMAAPFRSGPRRSSKSTMWCA
jgi:hypothetical protein